MSAKQTQTKRPGGEDQESEVFSAIAAFEQILEAIPNDRTSIETLTQAYEQIGDLARAKDYAIRLADVIIAESDHDAAQSLVPKLESLATGDPAAAEVVQRLKAFAGSAPGKAAAKPQPDEEKEKKDSRQPSAARQAQAAASAASVRSSFNIANELPLAWNLLKANELTQEEYSSVVQDLTEMSATDAAVTVSVLHVLHDRAFKNLPKVLVTLAGECGTPVVSLANFELQADSFSLLPRDFLIRRGVIIFDSFGGDGLAVIMNPYDKELMKEVESIAGRKCFFYLTPPAEFDAALAKINAWFDQQASPTPGKAK